jgi:hypothetical protein
MVYFQTKVSNLGKFVYICVNFEEMLAYFMAIWNLLRPYGIFLWHLIYSVGIWYILAHFGMLHDEKSGNPGTDPQLSLLARH